MGSGQTLGTSQPSRLTLLATLRSQLLWAASRSILASSLGLVSSSGNEAPKSVVKCNGSGKPQPMRFNSRRAAPTAPRGPFQLFAGDLVAASS